MRPNSQFPGDLVIFTEEILNGKLNFLCSIRRYEDFFLLAILANVLDFLIFTCGKKILMPLAYNR